MKKLLPFLMLAVTTIAGCNFSTDNTGEGETAIAADSANAGVLNKTIVYKTLNGIPEKEAKNMIDEFQRTQGTEKYDVKSFFIQRDVLVGIYNMLLEEIKAQTQAGKKYKTDGIRFYFGRHENKIKLILVSTTDSIPYKYNLSENMHHDYYGHSAGQLTSVPNDVDPEAEDKTRQKLLNDIENGDEDLDPTCRDTTHYGWMTVEGAKTMVNKFSGSVKQTHAVWFGLDRFKNMLKESKFGGLRIYLSDYPLSYNISTLVLTTTDEQKIDYFDCKVNKSKAYLLGPPLNNGSLCPLNCN